MKLDISPARIQVCIEASMCGRVEEESSSIENWLFRNYCVDTLGFYRNRSRQGYRCSRLVCKLPREEGVFQLLPVSFFKMPVDLIPSDTTIAVYPHPPQVSFQLRLRGNAAAYRWFTPSA